MELGVDQKGDPNLLIKSALPRSRQIPIVRVGESLHLRNSVCLGGIEKPALLLANNFYSTTHVLALWL